MSDPTDENMIEAEAIGPGHPDFDDEHARAPSNATGEDPPVPVVDLPTIALDQLRALFGDSIGEFIDEEDDDSDPVEE